MGAVMAVRMTSKERHELIRLANKLRAAGLAVGGDLWEDPELWMAEARRVLAASKR